MFPPLKQKLAQPYIAEPNREHYNNYSRLKCPIAEKNYGFKQHNVAIGNGAH